MLALTSTMTQVVFWSAAAVAIGALVWWWDKLAGRQWWKPLLRVVSLATIMTVTVLAAGVSLNKTYGWYISWTDLFSTGTPKAQQVTAGAPGAPGAPTQPQQPAPQPEAPAVTYPTNAELGINDKPTAAGQWIERPLTGASSGYATTVRVWLPASYVDPAQAKATYPVILALHGFPGQPADFQNGIKLDQHVAQAVAAGTIAEPIIVVPNIGVGNVDTECVNGKAGQPQVETFLAADLRDWVAKNLRTKTDRSAWATYGYSGGGYCAAMTAMLHPDKFSAAVNMAGYNKPDFAPGYRPFTPGSPEYDRYDMLKLAKQAPPAIALRVQTSKADSITWGPTSELLKAAKPPLAVTAQIYENVGHRFSVWSDDSPAALTWLAGATPGFAPAKR